MPGLLIVVGISLILGAEIWFGTFDNDEDELVTVVLFFITPLWILKAMSHGLKGLPPIFLYILGWLIVFIGWLWADHPA